VNVICIKGSRIVFYLINILNNNGCFLSNEYRSVRISYEEKNENSVFDSYMYVHNVSLTNVNKIEQI